MLEYNYNNIMKKLQLLNLLTNMIDNNNNNKNKVEVNKLVLKNLLLNTLTLENNEAQNKIINKYTSELNNKGNKLQHLNNLNSWTSQVFQFNKQLETNTVILDRLVTNLLYKLFSIKLFNMNSTGLLSSVTNKQVLISKPIYEHSANRVNIKLFYYINYKELNNDSNINQYYISILSRLINVLNNDKNNLSSILSNYYNKHVTIEVIKLSYNYLNSDIFAQSINKDVNKYSSGIKGQYYHLLNSSIPKLNDQSIAKDYINNINTINKLKYNNIINRIKTNKDINSIISIYDTMNISNIPMNILMFKYLTGWAIQFNGRLASSKAISRTNSIKLLVGTFRNKKYLWSNINNNYKLNYIPANNNISNYSSINKNGKYNIKVKLNIV